MIDLSKLSYVRFRTSIFVSPQTLDRFEAKTSSAPWFTGWPVAQAWQLGMESERPKHGVQSFLTHNSGLLVGGAMIDKEVIVMSIVLMGALAGLSWEQMSQCPAELARLWLPGAGRIATSPETLRRRLLDVFRFGQDALYAK